MNTKDQKGEFKYRQFVVAVVDVLGQKDAIRRLEKVDTSAALSDDLIKALKASVGIVIPIRQAIKDFFKMYNGPAKLPTGISPTPEQLAMVDRARRTLLKTDEFSDMIVAFLPLAHEDGLFYSRDIYGVLSACAMILQFSIAAGHPVRGGIDVGWALEIEDGEIYGPAFLSAYDLQEHVAQHPRVVVGKNLVKLIELMAAQPAKDPVEHAQAGIAQACAKLITRDEDGCFIVDYLNVGARDAFGADLIKSLYAAGDAFVKKEQARFSAEGNHKLAARYAAVARYYRSCAQVWQNH